MRVHVNPEKAKYYYPGPYSGSAAHKTLIIVISGEKIQPFKGNISRFLKKILSIALSLAIFVDMGFTRSAYWNDCSFVPGLTPRAT
jgi:hypothetical protein